jgi:hypothetical protein
MTVIEMIFTEIMPAWQLFVNKAYTKTHKNLVNTSVADTMLQIDAVLTQGTVIYISQRTPNNKLNERLNWESLTYKFLQLLNIL